MGFGDAVSALLETYTNCIALLKAFKRRNPSASGYDDRRSLLRRSIRSDRAKVRRAYESRLSQCGSRLEKGDGPATSTLRRVLKKLTSAIRELLHMAGSTQSPALDYDSLLSLSNSSRVDAIRAMSQLSHRLSSSRSSLSSSGRSKSTRGSSSRSSASSSASGSRRDMQGESSRKNKEAPKKNKLAKTRAAPAEAVHERSKEASSRKHTRVREDDAYQRTSDRRQRASLISISTDSTKLGEIPERKWRSRPSHETTSEEYSLRAAYPLRPYPVEVKEKKGWSFWRR